MTTSCMTHIQREILVGAEHLLSLCAVAECVSFNCM